jgi:hypothetical protein
MFMDAHKLESDKRMECVEIRACTELDRAHRSPHIWVYKFERVSTLFGEQVKEVVYFMLPFDDVWKVGEWEAFKVTA